MTTDSVQPVAIRSTPRAIVVSHSVRSSAMPRSTAAST